MEKIEYYIEFVRGTHVLIAPLIYITLHLIRPILFIPVILICIAGGLIFGIIPGIILSIIGLMLSSISFYFLADIMPFITKRLIKMKTKIVGKDTRLTTSQMTILRLIPFIHYHLLSFIIYESSSSFRTYLVTSFYTVIPMVVVYTVIGQSVTNLPPLAILAMIFSLVTLFFLFRKKDERVSVREFLR
ncbi:VTT domain-containing protein [Amphibacillus sp. MSJ-3]|uniref:TVP38/TMEM64 family protein n=1 Tax=Amphibacillus sp. MSJ-3 TaxID=2841505 RepID=UPI001C0EF663|nr:VTT domain-containing protein [Amphibacillus sp. MSJ-3]MBU5593639.1 VTT domain-containing protein [Amphibacillus sp. MSJ-3]